MRTPSLLSLALAGVLALAACGGDGDVAADDPALPTGAASESAAPPVELDEGVAAIVNGEEIAAELIDRRVERLAEQPGIGQGPEGEELDEEQVTATLRSQVLTQTIFSHLILQGAQELDAEPDVADVDAVRDDLVEEMGGEEAFAQQVEAAGFTEAELEEELRVFAAVDLIGQRLVEQGDADAQAAPEGMSPEEAAAQQWLTVRIQEADVQVDQAYGVWDGSGQVIPATA